MKLNELQVRHVESVDSHIAKQSTKWQGQFKDMCQRLDNESLFKELLDIIINLELTYAVCNSENFEHDLQARGTINGLFLLQELIENYSAQRKAEIEPKFNKQDIV